MSEKVELVYDEVMCETDAAYLFQFGDENIWLPKSEATINEEYGTVEVSGWLVKERGLEGYEDA